jgi:hypothetical protein
LAAVGQRFILSFGYHFSLAASWAFRNLTSFRLELYDWWATTSKASDLDVDGNSIFRYPVIHILPHLMVRVRSLIALKKSRWESFNTTCRISDSVRPKASPFRKAVTVKG